MLDRMLSQGMRIYEKTLLIFDGNNCPASIGHWLHDNWSHIRAMDVSQSGYRPTDCAQTDEFINTTHYEPRDCFDLRLCTGHPFEKARMAGGGCARCNA